MHRAHRSAVIVALTLLLYPSLTLAQPATRRCPRMYTINYDPWIEAQSKRLHANNIAPWNDPVWLNGEYVADLQASSHELVNFRQTVELSVDEYPLQEDGFRYDDVVYMNCVSTWSGWHTGTMVNYKYITRNFDLARRVDIGEIDEVNNNCAPYFGYWETTMCGYGGYWCNSGAQQRIPSENVFVILGFNYERGVAEMLHSNCHRDESIMRQVYGSWSMTNPQHLWDRYTLNIGVSGSAGHTVFGIGNCHFPANGDSDYDYANTQEVQSTAGLWLTMDPNDPDDFPDLTGAPQTVSRATWGGPDYHRTYMNWYYWHHPHFDGTNSQDGRTRLNNWWEYIFNFNAHYDSNGHDNTVNGAPPAAQPYAGPSGNISNNGTDDWRPGINAAGRVVWAGLDGFGGMTIWSSNADGSDLTDVSNFTLFVNELPQINAVGQVVWQLFDGKTFWVLTGSADGSGSQSYFKEGPGHNWHADINDSGRIVWEAWDGEDYEIYSANADGTDITRLTDNTHGGSGKPRDDMWPRINNAGRVVWMGYDGVNWEIFAADADDPGSVINISNNSYENEYPQIGAGGKVVWQAWISSTNAEVYSANANGTGVQRLTSNAVMDWWPRVNTAGDVVWQQRNTDWEIVLNGTPITANATHDMHPVIDDDGRIVWFAWDGTDWEIYSYEGGTIYQITDNDYDDRAPDIAAGQPIAWHGESELGDPNEPGYVGPTTEIFTTASMAFAPGDVNCDGFVNNADIDPFVLALSNHGGPGGYLETYPGCDNADVNGDEAVNNADIDPFVALLAGE